MRTIFLLSLLLATTATLNAQEGFKPIFDGKTLEGWDGNPKFWSVQDGTITGQTTPDNPTAGNTFLIWRAGEVADFELKLEYKIVGGNSGIQYRSFEIPDNKWVVGGYQADIDSKDRYSGINYGERFRGVLADRGTKSVVREGAKVEVVGSVGDSDEIQAKIKKEDWNEYHIIARGNHFIHKINGVVTCELTDEDSAARDKGIVAVQLHAGPPMTVQFRKVVLKRLSPAANDRSSNAAKKKVVLMAGTQSHGYGAHEHYAGCRLLAASLQQAMPNFEVEVLQNGWPEDKNAFADADTIVMYCDGGGGHPVLENLEQIDNLADKGAGIVCIHYGVEIPVGDGGEHFLKWIGGYFEANWSVNPHWTANFEQFPEHAITRGVEPFEINDEWYYHMRFRKGMQGVTPILTNHPPKSTLSRPDGPHSGNPHVRAAIARGEAQHVAWAAVRPNGGRGFGFTGGHDHWNWGDPNFRKLVLNAIVWTAHGEVPTTGVTDRPVTLAKLEVNQDYEPPENFDREAIRKKLNLPPDDQAVEEDDAGEQPQVDDGVSAKSPHAAMVAAAQLKTHRRLKATLFASEPMMYNPTNIDIDHLGRVWVCEVLNYRRFQNKQFPDRIEGDRILVLEDEDRDGQADKYSTFYQGRDIDSVHGICILPDVEGPGLRALVSAKDSVFYLIDEDGDLKADRKELLFTGISGTEHDHGIHAFVFGPDGKLYFNFGNAGKQLMDRDGNPVIDMAGNVVNDQRKPYQEGMVFRCNLDGSDFETLGWNFRNNWEVSVDSFGTLWQSDNDDDGNRGVRINFVMEFGNYGYKDELTGAGWKEERTNLEAEIPLQHWHLNDPGVVPNLLQTGAGSPTGICVYEGRLLPKAFCGQVIHCDAGPNIVRAYPAKADAAGYSARIVNILDGAENNQWFRPSDVCVALDGSLLVADWYDPGVGGHRMEDIEHGRIFRVVPKQHKGGYRVPKYDFSKPAKAVRALQSPNLVVRSMAWRALHAKGQNQRVEKQLSKQFTENEDPRMRARALWLLGKMERRGGSYIEKALGDDDANIRIVALRLGRQQKMNVVGIARQLSRDSSPHVRREVAIALRHREAPEAADIWADLAMQHDGQDRWYLEALGIAADKQWDRFLDTWLDKVGDDWNTPAGRDIIWRSRAKKTPQLLAKILQDENTPPEAQSRYFRAFDFLVGPKKDEALESLLQL